MSEQTKSATADAAAEAQFQTDPEAGLGGAAGFADAETREILNLLGEAESGAACCGGSCCSA